MRLNQLLPLRYPLIQGGMANIATGAFAAAVSNAGALGLIGSGGMDADTLRAEIEDCKRHTDRLFGVNLMLMNPDIVRQAELVIELGVPVLTTGAGNPAAYMKDWKQANIRVFPVVASVALARLMERMGADGVIAEGAESGGHIGETTTMALLPQVCDAVTIPVIAAGGIADGRQALAAFAMGASGLQVGTCLLASQECPIHENYKNAILKAKDTGTIVTGRIAGIPVRILKNRMAREYVRQEKAGATLEQLEHYTLGSLRRAVIEGDVTNGSLMAGQVAGQLNEIRPLADIFATLFAECEQTRRRMAEEESYA